MKDIERLSEAVVKLGAKPEPRAGHGRVLNAVNPQGLLEAVLSEIEETILGRQLWLRNARGEEVRLEVSGRRLLRMSSVAPKELAGTSEALIGASIIDAHGPASCAVAEVLSAMAKDSSSIAIVSSKLPRCPDSAETGCSTEALRASWTRRKVSFARSNPAPVADLVARIATYSNAFVLLANGRLIRQEGVRDLIRHLIHLSRIETLQAGRFPSGGGSKSLVVISAATCEEGTILYARDENRPGFLRGCFVQNLRGFFKGVHLFVERLLHFLRRPMADGAV
jgi:hypothetical protein